MRRTFCTSVFGFLTLILLLLAGRTTLAQSTTDGAIGGTVYDTSGAPVAGAKITVRFGSAPNKLVKSRASVGNRGTGK